MREGVRRGIAVATTILALGVAGATVAEAAPSGDPIAIEATALVPLDTESALSIVGIQGLISIETRDERELRFVSREAGTRGAELPIGVWQAGSQLIVAPAPGGKDGPRQLHIEMPRHFSLTVDAVDSEISLAAVGGGIELRGKNVRVNVRASGGPLIAALEGGSLNVSESTEGSLTLRGTAVDVAGMSGNVIVRAVGGSVSLREIRGSVDVTSDDSKLVLDGLSGSTRVKAEKGDATVTGLTAGAEFEMSGTPLRLKDGRGDITVTSDAPIEFQAMAASMHLDMYGGSLRGKGNQGILEVRTRNTEINVESIDQGMRIQGDGLKAKIVDVGGELYIETKISDVVADRVGSVVLNVDRGNVTIQRATGSVQATVTGGDVHIIDGTGAVTLDLDGGDAEVSWASISGDKDSKIVNRSGEVTVRFPASGGCRVEAKSRYGRVDTDLPTVRVMDDLTEAQGPIRFGNRPVVNIVANGDIHLLDASKVHDEN